MKVRGFLVLALLILYGSAFSQTQKDTSFSLLFNTGMSFTHARDAHINRWLEKYGYPRIPDIPSSYNFEIAAMPAASRMLYGVRLSTINSVNNLSSFNFLAGAYYAVVKNRSFLVFAGSSVGMHRDIIMLNGQLPAEYQQLANQYHYTLALRRTGLCIQPGARIYWYPIRVSNLQIGVTSTLGYEMDFNSHWRLGYYSNNHGKYGHFTELRKPTDQQKVSEHGFIYSAGLSFRFNLH
ncbi:hypothetical protein [Puia dinghuensis]|uniref:DUF3575 domain-containing protein n=1 Tax=Puia dinghuensis TaxID=1792502 RepID=A0A8J2UFP9_9BACT|nr:hypothetical protein [Puia dinghuensis]GGB10680.1 hypothetical protein GCM10011511_37820 [Puia dinghuensis]